MSAFHRLVFVWIIVIAFPAVVPISAQGPDGIPVCPAQAVMCRVERMWTQQELAAEVGNLEPGEGGFFAHEDQLTFVYRSSRAYSSAVSAIIFGEVPMDRVGDSDGWVLTIQFDGVATALLTFGIIERSSSGDRFAYPFLTWWGPDAVPTPPINDPVQGSLEIVSFQSEALSERRPVSLYLPPNYDSTQTYPVIYMLDGEGLPDYVGGIDYLITEGCILPLIIVEVESAPFKNEQNVRGEEYAPGRNPERFAQHERFFTQEVRLWAEATYGASSRREERAIFGMSNGGLFAVEMTLRHPELYGIVFPFSAGASQDFDKPVIQRDSLQLPLFVYSTAGTLDPIFDDLTRRFAQAYVEAGAEVIFSERVSGHNDVLWQVEFVKAVQWAFGDRTLDCGVP